MNRNQYVANNKLYTEPIFQQYTVNSYQEISSINLAVYSIRDFLTQNLDSSKIYKKVSSEKEFYTIKTTELDEGDQKTTMI